jgi:hypothetical protein
MTDWKNLDIKALAEIVSSELKKNGIDAVLVGGACVSIYSENKYESGDLDYITHTELRELEKVMNKIGFYRKSGRHFEHPDCRYFVEFPAPPIGIGREVPITKFNDIGSVRLFSPTDCVKDRLIQYYSWKDPQTLEQALMVARAQKVNLQEIKRWSERENALEKYLEFESRLKTGAKK